MREIAFRFPVVTITLLHDFCEIGFKFINFFNSSRLSSYSLHDCPIFVFYAFTALLSL